MRSRALPAAIAVGLLATVALAAITWHSGPTVTFSSDRTSVVVTGNLSGLGNVPATAVLTIDGTVTYTCQNPGGNTAPGQNPVVAQTIVSSGLGNSNHHGRGTLNVTASITPAPTISGTLCGCPNGNWLGVNPQPFPVPITSVTLSITQGGNTIFGPVTYTP